MPLGHSNREECTERAPAAAAAVIALTPCAAAIALTPWAAAIALTPCAAAIALTPCAASAPRLDSLTCASHCNNSYKKRSPILYTYRASDSLSVTRSVLEER